MRLAYVCSDPGVPVFGRKGASVHVQAVLRALLRRGDQVHLLAVARGGEPDATLAGLQVHELALASAKSPAEREARVQQADASVAPALDRLHAAHGVDVVYERYSLWGRTATTWAAAHRVPSVLEVNAPLVEEQATHRVLVDRPGAERTAVQALSSAGAVLCVSAAVAAWARRYTSVPVHVVPNGVDTRAVVPAGGPVTPAAGSPFTVGFVGTLKPWHGVQTLLDAFGRLVANDPSYRLLVVGDGPLAGALHARLGSSGLDRWVQMTGAVAPTEVPALLRRMDVAVAPYPAMEGFYFSPLKVYEYLAAGLPLVASRVGDLPTVLDHGRLGVLVEPDDPAGLASAVAQLRADPTRRRLLGRAGRRRAVERHDWSHVVDTAMSLARVNPLHLPHESEGGLSAVPR
jgi:glycosyltransferase involved in cell wall biosynthesis